MDVLMPQLGETVAEGKIVKWFKAAGDAVKPGDNLFEIETDKTSMEVPATGAGTLSEIRFQVGETANVGAVVAVIADGGEAAKPLPPRAMTSQASVPQTPFVPAKVGTQGQQALGPRWSLPSGGPEARPGGGDERVEERVYAYPNMDPFHEVRTPERNFGPAKLASGASTTPLARRLAGKRGIDLTRVTGSGPHGRIVAADIDMAVSASPAMARGATATQVKALYAGIAYEEIPLDAMRRTIAARMVEAKQTIPHFYLTADMDVGRLIAMRAEANAAALSLPNPPPQAGEGRMGAAFELSLNDFLIKAWAAALQRVPAANAVWAGDRILRFAHSDIGVAVAMENGLITPVIRNAEAKTLTAISAEMRDLAARARARRLKPDEYQGGSSAISNLGMYGVREFAAIINPPHSTLLAVGATRRAAIETEDGGVRFVSQMTVTLSCDHRVIDGALGASLLAAFKTFVEKPVTALV
jgi:pyruvate dehydrogenase E2 component (dihydrolipoyllysine-residue acetyltransferase)